MLDRAATEIGELLSQSGTATVREHRKATLPGGRHDGLQLIVQELAAVHGLMRAVKTAGEQDLYPVHAPLG